jgi:hypothetical protein
MARNVRKTNVQVVKMSEPASEKVVENDDVRKFEPDDEITCRAVLVGRTYLEGQKTGTLYGFLAAGDKVGIEYQDLEAEVRRWSRMISYPMIIIEDEDFVKRFPKLQNFYKSLYPIDKMKDILRKSAGEIINLLPTLPPGVQDSLKGTAAEMVRTGELDSLSVIKALDDIWGTQLILTTGLFNANE